LREVKEREEGCGVSSNPCSRLYSNTQSTKVIQKGKDVEGERAEKESWGKSEKRKRAGERVGERESVCVCVCERERERERKERKRARAGETERELELERKERTIGRERKRAEERERE